MVRSYNCGELFLTAAATLTFPKLKSCPHFVVKIFIGAGLRRHYL
jgi:hypothetical protein